MTGIRARARLEITAEIKAIATRMLGEDGAAALSLRAIAREVGMVSSAIYRYFPTRDALLTALIIDAYDQLGAAVEEAEAVVRRSDLRKRFLTVADATRQWALENPHQHALIFGSPVPGYAARTDTIDPAARVPLLILAIVAQAPSPPEALPILRATRTDLKAMREGFAPGLTDEQLIRAIAVWTHLIGSINMELFGHLNGVVGDFDAWADLQMRRCAEDLGLSAAAPAAR